MFQKCQQRMVLRQSDILMLGKRGRQHIEASPRRATCAVASADANRGIKSLWRQSRLSMSLKVRYLTQGSKVKKQNISFSMILEIVILKKVYRTSGLFRFCKICLSVSLLAKYRVQPRFKYRKLSGELK